jgi:hypothetical protein
MTRRLGLLLAVLLTFTACAGSVPGTATPDPAIAFCSALETYGLKLAALDGLTPSATADEYKQKVTEAKVALADLIAVSGPYGGAQTLSLSIVQTQLQTAADQLPAAATAAEAKAALSAPIAAVIQEIAGTHNASCNTRPTPSSAS